MKIQELKAKFVCIFVEPLCKNKAFCRDLTYTVGKALARRFRINNHIVQKDLGTMKIQELKAKFVFIFVDPLCKN